MLKGKFSIDTFEPYLVDYKTANVPGIYSIRGTTRYIPIDHLKSCQIIFDKKLDLYSYGVTAFEVLTGDHPYLDSKNTFITADSEAIFAEKCKKYSKEISTECFDLIRRCISIGASDRFES
ncbi:MAG: serine/threonine protein kinase, partial [Bacteroidales bacterium]|nr:serine/threonine protein kinase [Bacteroidales bacterium]